MDKEKIIKRYEPLNFMLISGLIAISFAMIFSIYKYFRHVISGSIIPPSPSWIHWASVLLALGGAVLLNVSRKFSTQQKFKTFRQVLGASYFLFLLFMILLAPGFPLKRVEVGITAEALGYYYFGYIIGYYLLFLLIGLVAQTIILSQVFQNISYIDSFIFSVNPPDILNLKLLSRYMSFVSGLWILILITLQIYAL